MAHGRGYSMRNLAAAAALLWLVLIGQSAFATTPYPNYNGPNVSFTGIQETSTFGDPEPLFGAPTGSGNSLLFFPANFTASAVGAGGFDQTGSQLQATIMATSVTTIDMLNVHEFGDATLLGVASAGTGVFAGLSGFVTVLEVNGLPITPLVIGFNAGALQNGSFTPGTLGTTGLDRNTNPGTTLWSGQLSIDIGAALIAAGFQPKATKVALSLDNDLYAYTEFASNSAKIQKTVVDGPAIIIDGIPEPGTFALLCGGLVLMSLRARGRRA